MFVVKLALVCNTIEYKSCSYSLFQNNMGLLHDAAAIRCYVLNGLYLMTRVRHSTPLRNLCNLCILLCILRLKFCRICTRVLIIVNLFLL